jgi:hypothetical protein
MYDVQDVGADDEAAHGIGGLEQLAYHSARSRGAPAMRLVFTPRALTCVSSSRTRP